MSPAGSRGLPGWPLPLLLCRQPVQKAFAPTGAQALLLPQRPRSPLKATEDLAAFLAQESRSGSVLAEAGVLVPDRRISAKAGPDRCMSPSPDAGCSWGPASHRGPRENARTGPGPTRELPDCAPSLSDDLAQLAIALAQPPSSHGPFHVQHKEAKSPGTKIQRAKSPKSQIATSPPKKRKEAKAASEAEDAKGAKPVTPTPPKKAYRRRSSALSSDPRAQRPRQSEIERQMQASTPIPERNLSAKPTPKQISSATKEALRSRRSVFLPSSKRRDDEDLSAMAMLAQALEASRASLEVRMAKLASQLRVPLDVLNQAYEVFDVLSDKKIKVMKPGQKEAREFDVFQDAELSEEGFAKVLCTLMNVQDTGELPEGWFLARWSSCFTSGSDGGSRVRRSTFFLNITQSDAEEENIFLDYILHSRINLPKAPGTVKMRIAAIRYLQKNMFSWIRCISRIQLKEAEVVKEFRVVTLTLLSSNWKPTPLEIAAADTLEEALWDVDVLRLCAIGIQALSVPRYLAKDQRAKL
ncbi:unnamed protein product [Polarella glacialis]|uniref:Uncharacterized protein n=1 Tax=Polarella glacialis TaxID=89957 RepID=A0A813FE40_POLGL|nr:unnamed protein product [Polarella glacialis]